MKNLKTRAGTMTEKEDDSRTAVLDTTDTPPEPVPSYTLDSLFEDLGYCGRFQIIFVPLAYLPMLPTSWMFMFMIFAKYNPGWTCHDYVPVNSTDIAWPSGNKVLSVTEDGRSLSGNKTRLSSCDAIRLCENVTFNDGVSTIVTEWALVCDNQWVFPIIFTVYMSGVLLGSVLAGYFGDNLGRKFCIYGSAALLIITHIIAIFSVSWQMYAVIQVFIGVGCGGLLSTTYIYVSEFVSAKWRGILGAFPIWTLCKCTFALCVMTLKNWKHIHIVTALLAFLAFLPVFWLPESLRWLTIRGKLKKGQKIVQKIAKLNRRPVPDTTIMATVAETERKNMKTKSRYSCLDLFHKHERRTSIVLGLACFILAIGSNIIAFGLKALSGNFFHNLLLYSIIPFPARLVALVVTTRFGRKVGCSVFVILAVVCTFSFVAVQLLAPKHSRDTLSLVFAFGSFMMIQASRSVLIVWILELYPTGIRSLSFSFLHVMSRFGAVVSPYLMSIESLPIFGSYLILGVLQLVYFVALLTLPETKNKPLQDNMITKLEYRRNHVLSHDI